MDDIGLRLSCCRVAQCNLAFTTVCCLFQGQCQMGFLICPRRAPRPSLSPPPGAASSLGWTTPRCTPKELFKKATEATTSRENIVRSTEVEPDVLIARWRLSTTL